MEDVKEPVTAEKVVNTTTSEDYLLKNQKNLTYVLGGLLLLVGGYFGYQKWIVEPKNNEALSMMWNAEQYFEKDSFKLALNGDGKNIGFLDVISDYSGTKSGNLAHFYAGICYLHLGDFNQAIEYLGDYDGSDAMLKPVSLGALGDAYSELNDFDKALEYYKQAYAIKNDFTAPIYMSKAGLILEEKKQYAEALALYQDIKSNYPESEAGRGADKYIAKYELLAAQ